MLELVTIVGIVVRVVIRVLPSRRNIVSALSDMSVLIVEVWQRFWRVGMQSKV